MKKRIRISEEFNGTLHLILLNEGSDTDGVFVGEIKREQRGFARQQEFNAAFDIFLAEIKKTFKQI